MQTKDSANRVRVERMITLLQEKYSHIRSLSAEFLQIYRAPGVTTRHEQGTVVLSKSRKMRWHYLQPEEKFFISDGKQVYLYVPSEREATRAEIKEHDDIRASFAFFLGDLNLRRLFSLIEEPENESPVDRGNYVLRFIPKRPQSGFSELIVEVNPLNLQLRRVTIREYDGGRSDFLFSSVRENVAVSPSDFIFKAPPGVQVLEAK
jgi:outer membrane lipoprotein carrier protein